MLSFKKSSLLTAMILGMFAVSLWQCEKEPDNPFTPFNDQGNGGQQNSDTLAINSIESIQRDIFKPKCSVPGCHDGAFEPDFRTIQSTISTNVFSEIVKGHPSKNFTYRVVPGDTANSVLYQRITDCCYANENDRMPQDNIGNKLPDEDIERIANWILDGAKGTDGETKTFPNLPPSFDFPFYFAVDHTYSTILNDEDPDKHLDGVSYFSFFVQDTANFYVIATASDDSMTIAELPIKQLKTSYEPDGFDNPITTLNGVSLTIPDEGDVILFSVDPSVFDKERIVYMRFFINDGEHENDTQFPQNSMSIAYKTYSSFYVQQ